MLFSEKEFEGKVAIITGGGTGLGRAMALRLAGLGANVAIASRNEEHLLPTAEEIRDLGVECLAWQVDIRDYEKVAEMAKAVHEKFGRIDILVNNAAGNFICPAEKLSINGWNAVVNIVLNGTFHCSHAVGKYMLEQGSGSILNIIATYAWTGAAMVSPSASAKAGVLALARSLAIEWGPRGIRVNCIAPGAIVTGGASKNLGFDTESAQKIIAQRNPLGRLGTERELADLAAFLLSDHSGYINGEVVSMDGGQWIAASSRFGQ